MPSLSGPNIDKHDVPSDLQRAAVLIQAERFTEAHRLLLDLVKDDLHNPRLWLMLAWTAPNRYAAIKYYRACYMLDPGNELAKEGLLRKHAASIHKGNPINPTDPNQLRLNLESILVTQPSVQPIAVTPRQITRLTRSLFRLDGIPFTWVMVMYLLILAGAELVTTYYNPQFGLVLHGALMVLLFLHASTTRVKVQYKFLFTVALAPLIRLLSLSMPLIGYEFTYWYAIIGIPLLLSAFLVLRFTGYKLTDVGISASMLPLQLLIGLAGFVIGLVEYQILHPAPLVQSWHLQDILIPMLILLVFTGFLEEFIFRGLMQCASQDVLGKYGLYFVSLLFAVLHIGYRSFFDFVFVLLVGLVFAQIAKHTRSIWGVTLAHGLTNISLYIIIPLLQI